MKIIIQSLRSHEGNSPNYNREIEVEDQNVGWLTLTITEMSGREEGRRHGFNISKQAAEELMLALDLLLTDNHAEREIEEAAAEEYEDDYGYYDDTL